MTVQAVADRQVRALDEQTYRSIMTNGAAEPILPVLTREVTSWLASKGIHADVADDLDLQLDDARVSAQHLRGESRRSLHVKLVETQDQATWITELYAEDSDTTRSWIHLVISNDHGAFVSRPRVAQALLQKLPLGDSSLRFSAEPQFFPVAQVPQLVDLLLDPERNGIVFVAAMAEGTPRDAFVELVGRWTLEVHGLGQVIVLDASGASTLSQQLGAAHAVEPLTVRGFLPGVDPATVVDGRRHRVMSTTSLRTRSPREVRRILGRAARRQAAQRVVPQEIYDTQRAFARLAVQGVLDRRPMPQPADQPVDRHEPPVSDRDTTDRDTLVKPSTPDLTVDTDTELALVRELLGLEVITRESLTDLAQQLAKQKEDQDWSILVSHELEIKEAHVEALEDAQREVQVHYTDLQLDYAVADESRSRLLDEVRWLRQRLTELEDFDNAYGPPPAEAYQALPTSFSELAERLGELPGLGLTFTGDPKLIAELDPVDQLGTSAKFTWEAFLALADYARARVDQRCTTGVHGYLLSPPTNCRTVPARRHAAKESESTMNQFGHHRVFPVPTQTQASGQAVMQAHFKLGWQGTVSPRLHYLDDCGKSGLIVIGYIGSHLPIVSGG